MAFINENFLKLKKGYLFPEISRRVNSYIQENPNDSSRLIRCGIGDVTEPLPEACRAAMHKAIDEMGTREGFRGYGPEQGYEFLRNAIVENQFKNLNISADEIFISDGSKCDTGNILDIFGDNNKIAITDPVYPVYVDTNVMIGNTREPNEDSNYPGLTYLPCTSSNDFVPSIPKESIDIIYLCYPNNPTGTTATKDQLSQWVKFAIKNKSIIFYDSAYEAFIKEENIPHSIFEIEGAKECAIEFRSFSKNGGFTGTRCAYTIIPKELKGYDSKGNKINIHSLWSRRQSTKFNGVSYIVQRGAEAIFSTEGKKQVSKLIEGYMHNATLLKESCKSVNFSVYGGKNAPYIWVKCPNEMSSWDMFDIMLNELQIVVTPGSGFGKSGEGYFRISSFNSLKNVEEVCNRIKNKFR